MKGQREYIFEIVLTLFGWYFVLLGIKPFIQQQHLTIYVGNAIFAFLFFLGSTLIIAYFVVHFLKNKDADEKKRNQMGILTALVGGGLIFVSIVTGIIITPFGQAIETSYYTFFGLGCFMLLAAYLFKKMRVAKNS